MHPLPRSSDLALFLHLLGVLVMVSGVVVAGAAHAAAARREQPAEIAVLLMLARTGVLLAAPWAVLGAGAWLVQLERLRLDSGWRGAALGLFVVAAVLGGAGGQRPKQARILATRLSLAHEQVTPELRALLADRRSRALNHASAVALLAVLALMVFKP